MSEIINKLELVYDILGYFNAKYFVNYNKGRQRKDSICSLIGGGAECSSAGIPNDVECNLFCWLHKQFCDSMCYLYDDTRIMYPQLMTAGCEAESVQED